MPDTSNSSSAPLIEVHLGDFHLTIQRLPVPLLTFLTTLAGSVGTTIWFGH